MAFWQAMTWANVDHKLWQWMAAVGYNGLGGGGGGGDEMYYFHFVHLLGYVK